MCASCVTTPTVRRSESIEASRRSTPPIDTVPANPSCSPLAPSSTTGATATPLPCSRSVAATPPHAAWAISPSVPP